MNQHSFYIYSILDFSQKTAGSTRMRYYAKALANDVHKVFLVSCCSNNISNENFVEIEPNIFVLEKKKLTSSFFGTLFFLKNLNSFSKSKNGGKTFIVYPYPLVFLEVLGLLYLKLFNKYAVFYELNEIRKYTSSFHDPISLKRLKYSFKKVVFKTVFTLVQPLLYFYDGLICISTSIEKYGRQFNKNTLRIPILTDPNIILEKSNNIYSTAEAFNIGFSGTIDPTKEDLESFITVISKVKMAGYNVSFNLCGSIYKYYRQHFLEECKSRNELSYHGYLNEKELSTFLSQQDLLVIPRGYSLQNKYGFSTKLSDYLNHQKLILVTDISDNNLFIKDGINGFIVPPNNLEFMCEKLIYIIQNGKELKKNIIPNVLNTSRNKFYYKLYRDSLRKFLTQ